MEEAIQNQNRYKFINELTGASPQYFIACIDVLSANEINNRDTFIAMNMILQQMMYHINKISSRQLKLTSCICQRDIIFIKIDTIFKNKVIEILNKIIYHEYIYPIGFKLGYKFIENEGDAIDFIENSPSLILDDRYKLKKDKDIYDFDLTYDIERYTQIKKELALDIEDNFYLVYQPKIDTINKSIVSCEVLTRWKHDKFGNVYPHDFLQIIKNDNKEYKFDLIIFEKACKEISSMEGLISDFSINININSIKKVGFAKVLYSIAEKYKINTKNITIEILEDIDIEKYNNILNNIQLLAELGFKISLDDFGTGYSSYYRLGIIPFSEVKIAKEFLPLNNTKGDNKNKTVLRTIIELCKKLGCKVVVEGVEIQEDFELISNMKADYVQGYLFSKPLDKDNYIKFLQDYNK